MGFHVPGLGDLRFHLAPTGVGDVHLRVDVPREGDEDDSGSDTRRAYHALPPKTWPYPLDSRVCLAQMREPALKERAMASRAEESLVAASSAATRVTDAYVLAYGNTVIEPSFPETVVVPTLPPLSPRVAGDNWGHRGLIALGGGTDTALEHDDTQRGSGSHKSGGHKSETPVGTSYVGWSEETVPAADDSKNSTSRRPLGAQKDFVRGNTSNQPFTPGGAGWDKGALAGAQQRSLNAHTKSKNWLQEFEENIHNGAPPGFGAAFGQNADGVQPVLQTECPYENERGAEAFADSAMNSSMAISHDDLLLNALLTGDGGDGVLDDDGDSTGGDTSEEDEEGSGSDRNDAQNAGDSGDGDDSDFELSDVLRVTSLPSGNTKTSKKEKSSTNPTWCVMDRIANIDEKLRAEVPTLAKQFKFELDDFQKEAAYRMERGESVFVAAHTSAGKTVCAEYAFALATKHATRAIYTSPIKTISNQKFRDFSVDGFDVGLLTGDVSIKPDANCLIMTTEILRSMLYRGADLIRDVEWVIFDEVHYVNDSERGVVWEEVIIMLPKHVGLVLLSATVPNVFEFADWVGRTKRKKIFVTGTTKRPVPLEHVLYFGGDKPSDFYKVGERETFSPGGYKAAMDAMTKSKKKKETTAPSGTAGGRVDVAGGRGRGGPGRGAPQKPSGNSGNKHPGRGGGGRGGQTSTTTSGARGRDKNAWVELIRCLEKRELLPMVTFAFSKKRCDGICEGLNSLDLTTTAEKHDIHVFCERCLSRLSPQDRQLPQVLRVRELLRRGLGVHHAGLLPIVKEIVEMLFCRGVIKVLFSTETFAMGVNAPARCVCFQDLRKHDGVDFRGLTPGEYTQMAGRAGRRGLDPVGTVIIAAWENFPTETQTRNLLTGKATKLESQFRLTYGMILNLLRVEDLRVEDMLQRSFAEFHAQRGLGDKRAALALDVAALRKVTALAEKERLADPNGWAAVEAHDSASHEVRAAHDTVRGAMLTSKGAQTAMVVGRVVLVSGGGEHVVLDGTSHDGGGDEFVRVASTGGIDKLGVLLRVCVGTTSDDQHSKTYVVLFPCPEGHLVEPATKDTRDAVDESKAESMSGTEQRFAKNLTTRGDDIFGLGGGAKKSNGTGGKGALDGGLPKNLPWRLTAGGVRFLVAAVAGRDVLAITDGRVKTDAATLLGDDSDSNTSSFRTSKHTLTPDAAACACRALADLDRLRFGATPPKPLHPTKDLKIADLATVEAMHLHGALVTSLPVLPASVSTKLRTFTALLSAMRVLRNRIGDTEHAVSDANLRQMPDFEQRVRVLRRMGYLDHDKTVTLKGRVACEIATGDELVGTEIIFSGVLTDLSPEQAVAVLSALVFQEKNASAPDFSASPELKDACASCFALAVGAGETQVREGLQIDPSEYASSSLKFGLVEVVNEWAKGCAFGDACSFSDVREGSVVRTITRLDEMTRDVRNAARIMGDSLLFQKMELASTMIKRDIVFSASLYVAGAK